MQGSPSQIKAAQPGQLIELRLDRVQQAAEILKTRLQAWRVSIFGDRLHLTLDYADREIPEIKKIFSAAGIQVQSLRLLPFSLEDAFISVVQRINQG
jgi:ABC-2 type transport system ATP-binding protein